MFDPTQHWRECAQLSSTRCSDAWADELRRKTRLQLKKMVSNNLLIMRPASACAGKGQPVQFPTKCGSSLHRARPGRHRSAGATARVLVATARSARLRLRVMMTRAITHAKQSGKATAAAMEILTAVLIEAQSSPGMVMTTGAPLSTLIKLELE